MCVCEEYIHNPPTSCSHPHSPVTDSLPCLASMALPSSVEPYALLSDWTGNLLETVQISHAKWWEMQQMIRNIIPFTLIQRVSKVYGPKWKIHMKMIFQGGKSGWWLFKCNGGNNDAMVEPYRTLPIQESAKTRTLSVKRATYWKSHPRVTVTPVAAGMLAQTTYRDNYCHCYYSWKHSLLLQPWLL